MPVIDGYHRDLTSGCVRVQWTIAKTVRGIRSPFLSAFNTAAERSDFPREINGLRRLVASFENVDVKV